MKEEISLVVVVVLALVAPTITIGHIGELHYTSIAPTNQEGDDLLKQIIQIYQKMIDKMDSNLDRTLGALNRNGEYFREFRQAVLQDHDWVDQSRISRFFDSAINMLYFTR
jgi:hypothetical protein